MIEQFITDYFIRPVIERTGYNPINTMIYAIIALISAFLIYKFLKSRFTKELILYTVPFVLLGSTARVITDSIDTGIAQLYRENLFGIIGSIIDSNIYNYGFVSATPGIYIVVGIITIISLILADRLKKPLIYPAIGLVLWIPHFIIVASMFKYWSYLALILGLVLVAYGIGTVVLKRQGIANIASKLAVLAHSFDGASSFIAIEIFNRYAVECTVGGKCYFGQHVVERFFGDLFPFGTFLYFGVKVGFAIFASWAIEKESTNEYEKNFIYLLIIIFGLAPGIRNILRILIGA